MSNPPFIIVGYKNTVPKGLWNTYTGPWEDGPGPFVNPINSSTPVRYNGQDQVKTINAANPTSPATPVKNTFPSAAVGMSKIP